MTAQRREENGLGAAEGERPGDQHSTSGQQSHDEANQTDARPPFRPYAQGLLNPAI
jgi:hypothetical protein